MAQKGANNKGALSRDELASRVQNQAAAKAQTDVQVIEDRQNPVPDQVREQIASTNVSEALNSSRSLVERTAWAVVLLTNGMIAIEQFRLKRDFFYSADKKGEIVNQIMSESAPFGKYNKAAIISIEPFPSEEEAERHGLAMKEKITK